MPRLVLAWLALLALLALTTAIALLPTGAIKPWAAILIALVKASIIYWYFIELRQETPLVRLAVLASGAWLLLIALIPFLQLT